METSRSSWRYCVLRISLIAVVFAAAMAGSAATPANQAASTQVSAELPQDSGAAGLKQMLLRLRTTARLLHTTAHPDDEDGGMLVLESRGRGASVVLLTLNRGEGGQNKVGSNFFDELGVLRTLELLASDRHYGVEQRFTRVADFGYSKSAEETFAKWRGHEVALENMVRVIRTFHPDVIVSRFQGATRDGHGHHEAAGILSREAFRAAADSKRFPQLLREGLRPWQASKLYMDNVREGEDYTVKLDTGTLDQALGMSYVQFAMEGLRHQLSQGAGAWQVSPGPHYSRYKLIDSALPQGIAAAKNENDFFAGIDTTLPGLAGRLGDEQAKVQFLRPALLQLENLIADASSNAEREPAQAPTSLMQALKLVIQVIIEVQSSSLSPVARDDLLINLRTKQQQLEKAVALAAGVELEGVAGELSPTPRLAGGNRAISDGGKLVPEVAFPGETLLVTAKLSNYGRTPLSVDTIGLDLPGNWQVAVLEKKVGSIRPGSSVEWRFKAVVPGDATPTRPYWHRSNPETETVYSIDQRQKDNGNKNGSAQASSDVTLPLPQQRLKVYAEYSTEGSGDAASKSGEGRLSSRIEAPLLAMNAKTQAMKLPLALAPAWSVLIVPATETVAAGAAPKLEVAVVVYNNVVRRNPAAGNPATGASTVPRNQFATLQIEMPRGWKSEPASVAVEVPASRTERVFKFRISPGKLSEGQRRIKATLSYRGKEYSEGYTTVARPDLGAFYYYQPAIQQVSVVEVKLPAGLKVGYIMGAGDAIPAALRSIGLSVTEISPAALPQTDLAQFATIVLGIRAYDSSKEVRENNQRLLDFVSAGGTLIVQYNTDIEQFNQGKFSPYPAAISHNRVSVEEAPVEILAPQDRLFNFPNVITPRDFDGWVQERGLYFMNKWDNHFEPLLASHDPGETSQKGGLLRARYGRGIYIYTGYAFFRQLPAGVPGAIRLYVNLLSAGDHPQETR